MTKKATSKASDASTNPTTTVASSSSGAVKAKTLHSFFARNNIPPAEVVPSQVQPSAAPADVIPREVHTPAPASEVVTLTIETPLSPIDVAASSTPVDLVTPCCKGAPADSEPSPVEPSPAEPSPAESSPAESPPTEPSAAEPSAAEPSAAEPSPAEPSPAEPSPAEPAVHTTEPQIQPQVQPQGEDAVPSSSATLEVVSDALVAEPKEPGPIIAASQPVSRAVKSAPLFSMFQKKKAPATPPAATANNSTTTTGAVESKATSSPSAASSSSAVPIEELVSEVGPEAKQSEQVDSKAEEVPDESTEYMSSQSKKRNREVDRLAKKCRGEEDAINVFDSTVEQNGMRRSTRVRQQPSRFTEVLEGEEDDEAQYNKVDSATKKARKSVDSNAEMVDDGEVQIVGEETPAASSSATKQKRVSKGGEGKGGINFFATPEEKARLKALEKEEQARRKAEEEQARRMQQALETELRLQEDILKKRVENDRFLAASTTNRTNSSASIFNRTYSKPTKTAAPSSSTVVILDAGDSPDSSDYLEIFPSIANVATPSAELQAAFNRLAALSDTVADRKTVRLAAKDDGVVVDISADEPAVSASETVVDEIHPDTSLQLRALWTDYIVDSDQAKQVDFNKLDRSISAGSDYSTAKTSVTSWLKEWINRRNASSGRGDAKKTTVEEDDDELLDSDEDFDDGEASTTSLNNMFFVVGPLASGKTNLIWECARQLKINIIEINASQVRSSKDVKSIVSEASQSRKLQRSASDAIDLANDVEVGVADFSLILFDEVDLVLDEAESNFHSALRSLAGKTKCPIALTAERIPVGLQDLQFSFAYLPRPSLSAMTKRLQSCGLSSAQISVLAALSGNDVRASLQTLDLISSRVGSSDNDCELVLQTAASKKRQARAKGDMPQMLGEWMRQQQSCVAMLDYTVESLASSVGTEDSSSVDTGFKAYCPVVVKVQPCLVPVNYSEAIVIEGKHFLQRSSPEGNQLATIQLFVNNQQCEVEVISDSKLQFCLPENSSLGLKTLRIALSFTSSQIAKPIVVSNLSTGVGRSWLFVMETDSKYQERRKYLSHKHCRTFDFMRSVYASMMKAQNTTGTAVPLVTKDTAQSTEVKKEDKVREKRLIRPQRVVRHVSADSQQSKEAPNGEAEDDFDPIESFSENEDEAEAAVDTSADNAVSVGAITSSRPKRHRFDSDDEETGADNIPTTTSTATTEDVDADCPSIPKEEDSSKRQRIESTEDDAIPAVSDKVGEDEAEESAAVVVPTESSPEQGKVSQDDLLVALPDVEKQRQSTLAKDCFQLPPGLEYTEEESVPVYKRIPSPESVALARRDYEALLAGSTRLDHLSDMELIHSFGEKAIREDSCVQNAFLVQHSSLVYHSLATCYDKRFNPVKTALLDLTVDCSNANNSPEIISLVDDPPVSSSSKGRDVRKEEQAQLVSTTQSAYLGHWYERQLSMSTLSFFIQMYIKDNIQISSFMKSHALMTETIPFIAILARFGLLAEERSHEAALKEYSVLSDRIKSKRQVPQRTERFKHVKNVVACSDEREIEDLLAIGQRLVRFPHPVHVQLPDF